VTYATHLVLFKQLGENSTSSRDPIAPWTGQVSLDETTTCCLSSDDDRLVSKALYEVREVTLPAWLSVEEWVNRTTHWKWVWGAGVNREWPEAWQRGLGMVRFSDRYWAAKLLATKSFRSEFRKSLRDQIVAWLETAPEARRYDSPLSDRQWDCLARNAWEAKRLESSLYYNRSWPGRVLSNEEAMAAVANGAAVAA